MKRLAYNIGIGFVFCMLVVPAAGFASEPLIREGDRVALIGGTLIESLQTRGDLEATVLMQRPSLRVAFRNLGWSGDDVTGQARRVFGEQPDGYARLLRDLGYARPTVAVIGYGFAEAANGLSAAENFEAGLQKLCDDLLAMQVRLVLVKPFPMPGVKTADYVAAIERCRLATERVAGKSGASIIDPAPAMNGLVDVAYDPSGLRLNERGQSEYSRQLAAGLLGVDAQRLVPEASDSERYERLCREIASKDSLFFHRHRPMNETYLFLFRKHEQGNNAIEVDQFEQLVEQAEAQLWGGQSRQTSN